MLTDPALYRAIFPLEPDAVEFAVSWLARPHAGLPRRMLDVGAGTGNLAAVLSRRLAARCVPLDIAVALLPRAQGAVGGDLLSLPFRDGAFGAAVSFLFPLAYAAATSGDAVAPWREVGRVLAPGGMLLAEVPLAHRPHRLQGVEERAELPGGLGEYRFRYLMAGDADAHGAFLDTEITAGTRHFRAPLFVYTPVGVAAACRAAGFELVGFCAPYDRTTFTAGEPPPDCRSAVVVAVKPSSRVTGSACVASVSG